MPFPISCHCEQSGSEPSRVCPGARVCVRHRVVVYVPQSEPLGLRVGTSSIFMDNDNYFPRSLQFGIFFMCFSPKNKVLKPETALKGLALCNSAVDGENCWCSSVTKSCLTRCNPVDCSPPGSSVHRISQARTLEWAVFSFSGGSS